MKICIGKPNNFSLSQIFDCGQCFRFERVRRLGEDGYEGVAFGKFLRVEQSASTGEVFLVGTDESDLELWRDFLDLTTDYTQVMKKINSSLSGGDLEIMKTAQSACWGIRILRQEPWEALCSFIISQNNNIPRIKKIISALCRKWGEKIYFEGDEFYTFPTPRSLAAAGEAEIFNLKTGFRAKYIFDAALKVSGGEIDLESVRSMPAGSAAQYLMQIKGVGPKVAACTLLFGYSKRECLPIDVWMKRCFENNFGGRIPDFGEYAGVAQQYLFHYERTGVNK